MGSSRSPVRENAVFKREEERERERERKIDIETQKLFQRRAYFLQRALTLKSFSVSYNSSQGQESISRERGKRREKGASSRHCEIPPRRFRLRVAVKRLLWPGADRSLCFWRGTRGTELHHTDKKTTYAWISALFPFANAKGNMQRSLTILYTSLLGMCLGSSSSFPSNINIGENGAHASDLYVSISISSFTSCLFSLFCVFFPPSIVSNINSSFFAAQQEDCSPPNRTNMRSFVSPSLTTRTSPNWCRRWIWSRWGIVSPWHTPVSRLLSLPAFLTFCLFSLLPPSDLFTDFRKDRKKKTPQNYTVLKPAQFYRPSAKIGVCLEGFLNCCVGPRRTSALMLSSAWLRRDFCAPGKTRGSF